MGEVVDGARPMTVRVLVGLLWAKAAVLGGLTGWLLYADLFGAVESRKLANFVTVYTAVYAALFVFIGWAVFRGRSWSRGPATMLELFLFPIGYYMIVGGLPLLGVPVMILGVIGVALLLAPSTRAALGLLPRRPDPA